jgi:hypothetical protein
MSILDDEQVEPVGNPVAGSHKEGPEGLLGSVNWVSPNIVIEESGHLEIRRFAHLVTMSHLLDPMFNHLPGCVAERRN